MADQSVGSLASMPDSPGWIRPCDVMKTRKLKARRRALEARMSATQPLQILVPVMNKNFLSPRNSFNKRRNPFKSLPSKVSKASHDEEDNSSDATLFRLMDPNFKAEEPKKKFTNFAEALRATAENFNPRAPQKQISDKIWSDILNVDWSLKSRMRFFSPKALPWKQTFKSIEEASGTTGFVRCLNSDSDPRRLDTSTNTQFYECCLVWQHPSLPTIKVFPRGHNKISAQIGLYGANPKIASALLADWSDSLRSLYQLLRVRMCPYFYVCGHMFTCLFRAAGVGGVPHTHLIISPTTRGFRDAMRNEGIEFTMPLYERTNESRQAKSSESDENSDDETTDDVSETQETSSLLEDLGLETSQFPSLNQSRIKQDSKKYKGIDGSSQSLVYIEDMELQGFINFLLNCNSCVVTTGELAGVPPTLLSPVAFHGGTLKSLQISGGQVRNCKGELRHSVEVRGPILPTTVLHLTNLMSSFADNYSLSLTPIASTMSFSSFVPTEGAGRAQMAFASEGLVDCGLGEATRAVICNFPDGEKLSKNYKEIIYEDEKYHWTDK